MPGNLCVFLENDDNTHALEKIKVKNQIKIKGKSKKDMCT